MLRSFVALVAIALVAGACIKADSKTAVKADASGTITAEISYKVEAIDQAKARVEDMRARAEEAGREGPDQAQVDEQISSFVNNFDPEKATAELKSRGFEVKKAEAFEKDGWKGVKIEGTYADINQIIAADRTKREAQRAEGEKARAEAEAGAQGGEGGRRGGRGGMMARMGGRNRGGDTSLPFVAQFVSTDTPNIGKAILMAPRQNRQGGAGGGNAAGGRGGRGGGGGGGPGGMNMGMEELKRTLTISLPGKITETINCKKVDDTTVTFDVKGTDMQPDEDGNMPNMVTQGVAVLFEIPEGCKINFESPAAKAPEKKAEAPAPNKKKGELRTDGGGI